MATKMETDAQVEIGVVVFLEPQLQFFERDEPSRSKCMLGCVHGAELLPTLIRINEPVNIHELGKASWINVVGRLRLSATCDERAEAIAYRCEKFFRR